MRSALQWAKGEEPSDGARPESALELREQPTSPPMPLVPVRLPWTEPLTDALKHRQSRHHETGL